MTVAQLEGAVARLGFAPSIEDGAELLRDAAARALDEVAAARPRLSRVSLWHLPARPLYFEGSQEPIMGEKTFSLPDGLSFFLRVMGCGSFTVKRAGGRSSIYSFITPEGAPPAIFGGELPPGSGELSFRFSCEGSYRILTLAIYDTLFSGRPPDPNEPTDYDLGLLFPAFGGLTEPPKTKDGRLLTEGAEGDYTLDNGRILRLSPHAAGDIRLTYRRRLSLPREGELPVTEEEAALLPLFCAAYVYLEDDPEKAAFYLARFRDGLARLREPASALHRFYDRTRWG